MLTFDPDPALAPAKATEPDGSTILFLRAVLPYLQDLVTTEVATLKYLTANTTIPVPMVLRSDDTTHNVLGREFTLLVKEKGTRADLDYDNLTPQVKRELVRQMAGFANQLFSLPWNGIGSIRQDANGQFILGKYKDTLCWDMHPNSRPGLNFSEGVDLETLEIGGPFADFTSFIAAILDHCAYVIDNHADCAWLRELVPRVNGVTDLLRNEPEIVEDLELNETKLIPFHSNLHFGKSTMPEPWRTRTL